MNTQHEWDDVPIRRRLNYNSIVIVRIARRLHLVIFTLPYVRLRYTLYGA